MVINAIDDFWDKLDDEQKQGFKGVQEKWGDNCWWKSNDIAYVLKHQIEEPWLVVAFPDYLDILGKFLQRPVSHLDIAYAYDKIKDEVRLAIKRNEAGIIESEEQIEQGGIDYVNRLNDIVENKLPQDRVMKIDVPNELNKDRDEIDKTGYDGWLR